MEIEKIIEILVNNEKEGKQSDENDLIISNTIKYFPDIIKNQKFFSLSFDTIRKLAQQFFKNSCYKGNLDEKYGDDIVSVILETGKYLLKTLSQMDKFKDNSILLLNDIILQEPSIKDCIDIIGSVYTSNVCQTLINLYKQEETSVEQDYEYELSVKTQTIETLQNRISDLENNIQFPDINSFFNQNSNFLTYKHYHDKILRYCASGNLKELRLSIETKGVPVDMEGDSHATPLIAAAYAGQLDIVKYLVSKGADFNKKDKRHCSPVITACIYNHLDVVDYLVQHGADYKCYDSPIQPIAAAIYYDHIEIVKYLLDHGVSLINPCKGRNDPLYYAISSENYEITKYLLDKGASIDKLNETTPLCLACFYGNIEFVKLFLQRGAKPNYLTHSKESPLHFAAENGNLEIIDLLIRAGAQASLMIPNYPTPVTYAVSQGNFDAVIALVNAGALVNNYLTGEYVKYAPIYIAACKGYLNLVLYLVQSGAQIDVKDINDVTPLIAAVINGHTRIAEFLINSGADVNAQTKRGDTALILASLNNNVELVKLLLSKGANPTLRGKNWRTAYSVATNPFIIKMLQAQ